MADREIDAPHGSISVVVSMKGAKGGNELLAEAQAKAATLAAADGKQIVPDRYGENITITFALKG